MPSPMSIHPQNLNQVTVHRSSIDKIRKCGAEEFQGLFNDDPTKAECWLENIQWVFSELNCCVEDSLKCVISLLKEDAYE